MSLIGLSTEPRLRVGGVLKRFRDIIKEIQKKNRFQLSQRFVYMQRH